MDILNELVAKGVAGEVIVAVARLIADAEQTERIRAAARQRMRAVRERSRTHANSSEHKPALSLEEDSKKELKKESRRRAKTPLPPDWQPIGPQRDPVEPDEFRDHARAKGYQYSDWHAAYRNFQRSPYNPRNKPGAPQPGIAEAERVVMLEEFHRAQLNRRNANVQTTEKSRPDHAG